MSEVNDEASGQGRRQAMPEHLPPTVIEPTGVYAPATLAKMLGCTELTIRKAIARKRLSASRAVAGRSLVLGQWVLDWLTADWHRRQRESQQAA
jgi:hypothetical protein